MGRFVNERMKAKKDTVWALDEPNYPQQLI